MGLASETKSERNQGLIGLLKSNPNAAVSAAGTAVAALLAYLLGRYAGVHLNGYYTLLLAGGVSGGLLFLGRNGLEGAARLILRGKSAPAPSPPKS